MIHPSEVRELKAKVKQLQEEKEQIGCVILHEVTRIINMSDDLAECQRESLLNDIWKGRKQILDEASQED